MLPTSVDERVFHACLTDLESRIDPVAEEANLDAWVAYLQGRAPWQYFVPPPRRPAPAKVEWPTFTANAAQRDVDAMVLRELGAVSGILARGGGERLNVRCNHGTAILASLFGGELYHREDEFNLLPFCRPQGTPAVRRLVDAGVPDIYGALGGKCFATAQRFFDVFRQYPRIARWVDLYHPDVQGPLDVAEVVWGSEILLACYEDPPLVDAVLDLITRTYETFMRAWMALVPPRHGRYFTHWTIMHEGPLMLRNDSLMNLSSAMYERFIRPCDQRLFDLFGGGAIHFCGHCDHYIAAMSEMRGLTAVNMSQPDLNDMETMYRHTVDKGIKLLNLPRPWPLNAASAGRALRGQVQCF